MHIINNPAFLLFIEPKIPSDNPIIDIYTRKVAAAFRSSKSGVSGYGREDPSFLESQGVYKGSHICDCGHAMSSNADHLTEFQEGELIYLFPDWDSFSKSRDPENESTFVRGVIMNSLCVHYVACHRSEVPPEQLEMILRFPFDAVEPTAEELKAQMVDFLSMRLNQQQKSPRRRW